jgi:hypothetical protein
MIVRSVGVGRVWEVKTLFFYWWREKKRRKILFTSLIPDRSAGQGNIGQLGVCMCPHILEVKRVYDVYQYIFSGEESMCWSCIIYSRTMAR